MKITKSYLKQVIKEELNYMEEAERELDPTANMPSEPRPKAPKGTSPEEMRAINAIAAAYDSLEKIKNPTENQIAAMKSMQILLYGSETKAPEYEYTMNQEVRVQGYKNPGKIIGLPEPRSQSEDVRAGYLVKMPSGSKVRVRPERLSKV